MRPLFLSLLAVGLLPSCHHGEVERKPVPPTSPNGSMPWNPPIPGQGMGAFGNLPGANQRR